MKGYSMHEEHRANPEKTRRKTKKKQKRKPIHRLITKRKRANERRERITSCEFPRSWVHDPVGACITLPIKKKKVFWVTVLMTCDFYMHTDWKVHLRFCGRSN